MKKPIMGNTVGTPYKSVPRMSVLDKKEDNWNPDILNKYPRIYADSPDTKKPYNRLSMTIDAEAPKDTNGKAFYPGGGVYYSSVNPPPEVSVVSRSFPNLNQDNPAVKIEEVTVESNEYPPFTAIQAVKESEDCVNLAIRFLNPNSSVPKRGKLVFECGFRLVVAPEILENSSAACWIARLSFHANGTHIYPTSGNSQLMLWYGDRQDEEGNELLTIGFYPDGQRYSLGRLGEWHNLKFAHYGKEITFLIDDVTQFTTELGTDLTNVTTYLNSFDILPRFYTKTYGFEFTDIFCDIVDEDFIYSGRHLESVAGRRNNGHILVPSKSLYYTGPDADKYALSFGAAKEWIGSPLSSNIILQKDIPQIQMRNNGNIGLPTLGEVICTDIGLYVRVSEYNGGEYGSGGQTGIRIIPSNRAVDEPKNLINLEINGSLYPLYGTHYLRVANLTQVGGIKAGGDISVAKDGTVTVNHITPKVAQTLTSVSSSGSSISIKRGKVYILSLRYTINSNKRYDTSTVYIPDDIAVGDRVTSTAHLNGGVFYITYNGDDANSLIQAWNADGNAYDITSAVLTIREI